MQKVWNIGNTTVRNPKRIENALTVFVEDGFSGNAKGIEMEAKLHAKLKEKNVLEFEGEPSNWNGRKWRAAFYQLGFISYEKYNIDKKQLSTIELFSIIGLPEIKTEYGITPAGQKLINAQSVPEIEEIYTKQFVCYEIPNSLERNFPKGSMKPFILLLQVLKILQENGHNGLNKFETGVFLQKFRNHTIELPQQIVNEILEYRRSLSACSKALEKKELKNRYKQKLKEEIGIEPDSVIKDYSDTTFRYFFLSGLFSQVGQTIVIRANKFRFVDKLLQTEPIFLFRTDPVKFFEAFYKNNYPVPTDNIEFALQEIEDLKTGIKKKDHSLLLKANSLTQNSAPSQIHDIRFKLIVYNNWEREEDFAHEQQTKDSINDILSYLRTLNGESTSNTPEIDDRPAYLEWAVWRSFLAINEIISPIHTTRRFPVDQDFHPRNTAPGGGSDLIFEFDTYILVVEVTMTTSHRQMAVESEPVRRHTVLYKEQYPDKDIYCLFIAPVVDNNVAETFRIGIWYKADEEEFINIIPMNLADFISTIEILTTTKYKNSDFKILLDRCLVFRNVRAPQWKASISKEIGIWKSRLLAN